MSFLRWLKYKLIRIGALVAALASFFGSLYSFLYIAEPLKLYLAVSGIISGIVFIIISRYYKMKLQNLFFLKEKKVKGTPAMEA